MPELSRRRELPRADGAKASHFATRQLHSLPHATTPDGEHQPLLLDGPSYSAHSFRNPCGFGNRFRGITTGFDPTYKFFRFTRSATGFAKSRAGLRAGCPALPGT